MFSQQSVEPERKKLNFMVFWQCFRVRYLCQHAQRRPTKWLPSFRSISMSAKLLNSEQFFLIVFLPLSLLYVHIWFEKFCTHQETSNKKDFPTFARTRPPDTQISKSVVSLLLAYNWTQVGSDCQTIFENIVMPIQFDTHMPFALVQR